MRDQVEVLLDLLAAMAERLEEGPLAEAYADLYQAAGALFLREEGEDPEAYLEDLEALRGEGEGPRGEAARRALEALARVSPADGNLARALVDRVAAVEGYFALSHHLARLEGGRL